MYGIIFGLLFSVSQDQSPLFTRVLVQRSLQRIPRGQNRQIKRTLRPTYN